MPFPFVLLCDLLEQAYRQSKSGNKNLDQHVSGWFTKHRQYIDDPTTDASALLSTLLPEKRSDRVYGIQATRLSNICGRALGIGRARREELRRFEEPGLGLDLGDCIADILRETPNPCCSEKDAVTVEEIDATLNSLAARCRFSSPAVQASTPLPGTADDLLTRLYRRVQAREAKWLTRLILKNYQPVEFNPGHVYYCYDPLLPKILRVQDHFTAALCLLQRLGNEPSLRGGELSRRREDLMKHLTPILGVKVGRQSWLKGRSIKHCMNIGHGRMSCEKKIDGEYCQIHIDLSKGNKCIQIFSKSGKDSTADRAALHGAILDSLDIGKHTCKLAKGCILEGELVVYSDKEQKILPFHKIRKYVSRSGSFLHVQADSQRHHYEHLMIIYFDALLIDGESLLGARHSERFRRLTDLINCREGHAALVQRQIIDLDQPLAASHLRKAFAQSIASREEGLVLKPDDPYFDFGPGRRAFSGCPIKMKKEYIGSFGDVGDFAVIGARYDPDKAKCYTIPNLKWTHFYLGCLDNKEEVCRFQARPQFTVVHQVELNEAMLKTVITHGRPMPVPYEDNITLVLHIAPGIAQQKMPSVVFTEPLVFDIRCFSFDKEGNTNFWQPRFPQVSKIHFDRSFLDTLSFPELQELAEDATTAPILEDSQEMLDWIAALESADPRGVPVDAVSQSTTTSYVTPSRTSSARPSPSPASGPKSPSMARCTLPTLLEAPDSALVPYSSPSAPEATTNLGEQPTERKATEVLTASKRAQESPDPSPREHKQPRVRSEPCTVNLETPAIQPRRPLAAMSINRVGPSESASHMQSNCTSNAKITASPSKTMPPPDKPADQALTVTESTSGCPQTEPSPKSVSAKSTCQHAGSNCLLSNRVAILSPCIAQQPWITENLLPSHGILQGSSALRGGTPSPSPRARKTRLKRVCFVEHNRNEATVAFMRQMQDTPRFTPSGRREWIEVYDWRVLEDVTALEKVLKGSKPLAQHPDPKRKWFVGLV